MSLSKRAITLLVFAFVSTAVWSADEHPTTPGNIQEFVCGGILRMIKLAGEKRVKKQIDYEGTNLARILNAAILLSVKHQGVLLNPREQTERDVAVTSIEVPDENQKVLLAPGDRLRQEVGDAIAQIPDMPLSGLLADLEGMTSLLAHRCDVRAVISQFMRIAPLLYDDDGRSRYEGISDSTRAKLNGELATLDGVALRNRVEGTGIEQKYLGLAAPSYQLIEKAFTLNQDPPWPSLREIWQRTRKYINRNRQFVRADNSPALVRMLVTEQLDIAGGLLRSCVAADCALRNSAFYVLVSETSVYVQKRTSKKSTDLPPLGYYMVVTVAMQGRHIPFVISLNGFSGSDFTERIMLRLLAKHYNTETILIPDFAENPFLTDNESLRTIWSSWPGEHVDIELPSAWAIIDNYYDDLLGDKRDSNKLRGPSIRVARLIDLKSLIPEHSINSIDGFAKHVFPRSEHQPDPEALRFARQQIKASTDHRPVTEGP